MRKLITILLITTFVALALVACAGTPVKTETPATDTEQISAPKPTENTGEGTATQPDKQPANSNDLPPHRMSDDELRARDENTLSHYREMSIEEEFVDNVVLVTFKYTFDGDVSLHYFDKLGVETRVIEIYDYLSTINEESDAIISMANRDYRNLKVTLSTHDKEIVLAAAEQIMSWDEVLVAQPNPIFHVSYDSMPEDPLYDDNQWALKNTGYGTRIEDVWNILGITGNTNVKVGIFEEQVDGSHEDLASRIINYTTTPLSTNHGTMVAGIIGAIWNDKGIAGVTQCTIHVLDPADFINAIDYAENNEIGIINASFHFIDDDGEPIEPPDEIYEKINNYSGLIICSAGNDGVDMDNGTKYYPACYNSSNIITVGALDQEGKRWGHTLSGSSAQGNASNYGATHVDLFAPGVNILSTAPYSLSPSKYAWGTGTSFAAPFVTGVAALLKSHYPDMTPLQIKEHILNSITDNYDLHELCYKRGHLNAYNAFSIYYAGYVNTGNENYHYARCTVCNGAHNYNRYQAHTPTYYSSNTKHFYRCSVCGYQFSSGAHTLIGPYHNKGATVGHSRQCLVCEHNIIETHNWIYNPALGKFVCANCPAKDNSGASPYDHHDEEEE